MTVLLKQAKDIFIVLFGGAGLILVLFPLMMIIVLKKGVQQILARSGCEDQNHDA